MEGVRRRRASFRSLGSYLEGQRNLLGLDAIEYYPDPLEERVLVRHPSRRGLPEFLPRIPVDVLSKAFSGEKLSLVQHLGVGDLIRCLVPVGGAPAGRGGVVVVNTFVPVSVVNKVDEISNVIDDYRDVNPLRYPIKSTYLVILVMITLVIVFVAIWLGLYLARQLTDPLEQLVQDALDIIRPLGLRYRVIRLATADLTFASAMTYDIEVWAPGAHEWLEVSSVSNFLDFQARRANLRYRDAEGHFTCTRTGADADGPSPTRTRGSFADA